jgi:photosystem II stability/assembly factor-like uncharacterized protein
MKQFTLLAAWVFLGTAWPGDNVWTSLGPDGGGARSLVIDPLNPNKVYALTSAGMFRSWDGGAHWSPAPSLPPNSGVVFSLVIDPQTPSTLYAANREVFGDPREVSAFKSTDGGASWRALKPGISAPLAIDPEDPRIIYAGGYNDIFKSTDGGETWSRSNSGLPATICCIIPRSLVIDPQNPSTVYAVAGVAIFKSTNRGASWSAVYPYSGRQEDPQFATLAIDPQNSNTLYGVGIGFGGLYKSTDGGAGWSAVNSGLPPLPVEAPFPIFAISALAIHPQESGTLYVSTRSGVFKSTDGAANWTRLDSQPAAGGLRALAIDPQTPGTIYASAADSIGAGVYKSTDGAVTWSAVNSGLRATGIYLLAIPTQQPATLYANASSEMLLKSTDGGASWSELKSRLLLAIDPQDPATLFGIDRDGLVKSTDGGASWSPANAGLPEGPCHGGSSLAIDRQDTRTLYRGRRPCLEGTGTGGVWKSTDGGARWEKPDSQPGGGGVHGLEVDPNTNTLYVWNGMGLFRSMDRGASWTRPGGSRLQHVAIDPQAPGTLYGVINDNCGNRTCDDNQLGVHKTTDGGESWTAVLTGLTTITALVIDPRNTGTLYAGTGGNGVYRTTDGGASWNTVNSGLTTLHVHTLAIDPQNSSTIYAGTEGGVFAMTFASQ